MEDIREIIRKDKEKTKKAEKQFVFWFVLVVSSLIALAKVALHYEHQEMRSKTIYVEGESPITGKVYSIDYRSGVLHLEDGRTYTEYKIK